MNFLNTMLLRREIKNKKIKSNARFGVHKKYDDLDFYVHWKSTCLLSTILHVGLFGD